MTHSLNNNENKIKNNDENKNNDNDNNEKLSINNNNNNNDYKLNKIRIKNDLSSENNVLDIDEEKIKKNNIENIIYVLKKPNIGHISDHKIYNELINSEIDNKKNGKNKNNVLIIENKNSIDTNFTYNDDGNNNNNIENKNNNNNNNNNNENENKNDIENENKNDKENIINNNKIEKNHSDCDCYLIPYQSLKTTIKACQNINRGIKKLNNELYSQKATTIYKDYYLNTDNNKSIINSDNKSFKKNEKNNVPIKHIISKSKNKLKYVSFDNEHKSKSINDIYRNYYYNSVNDNYEKYKNDLYDVKAISLGNLKFHTLFQKKKEDKPLMINGYSSNIKAKSTLELKSCKKSLTYEEKRLKPYHSYSSYSSILSSYPSYTFDQDVLYRRKIKQHAVKKSLNAKKKEITIKRGELVHISIFSLPNDKYIKTNKFKFELEKHYAEELIDDLPNLFKDLKIPYIKIPDTKKKRNLYDDSDIEKGHLMDLFNFICPPMPIDVHVEIMPEPRYAQVVKIIQKGTKVLSTKSISFKEQIKIREIDMENNNNNNNNNNNDSCSDYSTSKTNISSKSFNSSSSSENEEDDSKSFKSYDGIKEEMVSQKKLMKSDEIINSKQFFDDSYLEYDTRSKLSSSTTVYSNKRNNSKKSSSSSLYTDKYNSPIKIPSEKILSEKILSEKTLSEKLHSQNLLI
ncbi:hypothetical protein BCR32DRAFT_264105 [Anaeromyces robustus]|uniref:Uncharacterized protein n=1 Tax=Anaeromyces robustus TaxID=1754192 RepID=A0A1Y1XQ95_9FUNG|nr:hypothetical protein BCR32DRAFT_264105 [Anaeromyces robustus]|eukprot:ORX87686.1 hypothetical protein BCR32DRAFT_264105 [Anaeromyces robustus]